MKSLSIHSSHAIQHRIIDTHRNQIYSIQLKFIQFNYDETKVSFTLTFILIHGTASSESRLKLHFNPISRPFVLSPSVNLINLFFHVSVQVQSNWTLIRRISFEIESSRPLCWTNLIKRNQIQSSNWTEQTQSCLSSNIGFSTYMFTFSFLFL